MGRKHRWSTEQLVACVASAYSMRATLLALGLRPLGSNYGTIRRHISLLGLSTSHWRGQGWLRGRSNPHVRRRSLEEILRPGTTCGSMKLKKRLIREGVMQPLCVRCGNRQWLDEPIPLELDHIDGDSSNNSLANLRLLCPNCHAKTPTYRAKNRRLKRLRADGDVGDNGGRYLLQQVSPSGGMADTGDLE
jgi:hypothetical protein